LYTELGLLKQIPLSLDSHDLGLVVFLLTSQSNVHHKRVLSRRRRRRRRRRSRRRTRTWK
jgi:hypothetical protein